ncbi:MAG: periplasmic heavy metal sensor [Bacteroidetes bacterium]|nr:periplasmic heavy metal sensor [Bacteroidota bacterium]
MKNNKLLTIAVIALLLSNIGLVAFMLTGKSSKGDRRHGRREPFEMMVKELNMTEQQQKEYKQMKEEHMKNVRPLFDSVRAAKSAFFTLIKDSTATDSLIHVYSRRISEKQAALDKITFTHFRNVRKLFTAEQQPGFDSFMQKMMQRGRRDSSARNR